VVFIQFPTDRIIGNVVAEAVQFIVVADDVFVVVSLPQFAWKRGPAVLLDASDVCVGGRGLEPLYYPWQGRTDMCARIRTDTQVRPYGFVVNGLVV